jgi:hypothetical protein
MSIVYRSTVGIRRVLARRPWLYWVLVTALAGVLAAATEANLSEVQRARDAWGETTTVLVATGNIAPGQPVAEDARWREFASAMVPANAVSAHDLPAIARQHISTGEIVTTVDITATDGQLALVPDEWLAVVVAESPRSGATVGNAVRLVSDGVVIAEQALVIGEVDGATLIAVPENVAPLVPVAAESGSLTLLRVP